MSAPDLASSELRDRFPSASTPTPELSSPTSSPESDQNGYEESLKHGTCPPSSSHSVITDVAATAALQTPSPDLVAEVARVMPLIDALEPRVIAAMAASPTETVEIRSLYSEMELLRLDFSDHPCVAKFESDLGRCHAARDTAGERALRESSTGSLILSVFACFDGMRKRMVVRPVHAPTWRRVLGIAIAVVYMVIVIPFLLMLVPLRALHPLLRRLGVPTPLLPIDALQIQFSRGMLAWVGVTHCWDGLERIDPKQSYIVMYSHQSSYDAFAITSSPLPVRLIGKKSLFFIPLLGWLAFCWGHIAINRGNLTAAIKALDKALTELRTNGRSLCIAPEGTRSPIGRLIDFKKGPFHIAMQAKSPIVPVLFIGASDLWPAKTAMGAPGQIRARVLAPIEVREGESYQSLRSRVHRAMLAAYAEPVPETSAPISNAVVDALWFPVAMGICYFLASKLFGF